MTQTQPGFDDVDDQAAFRPSPRETARETWAALVPLMASAMRVSRDGGRSYKRRGERPVTAELPNQPAAVLLYDKSGCTDLIALDLDVTRGGLEAVDRDFRSLSAILSRAGLRWISDRSPSGGRHLYVPLAEPVSFHQARRITLALVDLAPTLDPMPMLGLDSGCIRPPGAVHRTGGHQVLAGSLEAAQRLLRSPNPPAAWRAFVDDVDARTPTRTAGTAGTGSAETPHLDRSPTAGEVVDQAAVAAHGRLSPLAGLREPDNRFQTIARTGDYPSRYRSDSEARQAVVWACVASGWALVDVARRLQDGTWPGLASFYARYSTRHRHQALVRDWRAAISHEKRRREARGFESVRLRTTSPIKTQRGAVGGAESGSAGSSVADNAVREATVRQYVSGWLTVVDHLAGTGTLELADRAVLYALAEAAIKADTLVVEFGNRSLAIATGMDQSSVGRALRRLADTPPATAVLDLVRPAQHVRAASYRLLVPAPLEQLAASRPWRRGRVHAVRPAFRELGLPAAFVYAVLEHAKGPMTGREIAERAHLGITATYDALTVLAAHDLAARNDRPTNGERAGWTRGDASLARLAEAWGVLDDVRDQLERYRAERRAWWTYLGIIRLDAPGTYQDTQARDATTEPPWPTLRPDEDVGSLLDLLERELGAQVIDVA